MNQISLKTTMANSPPIIWAMSISRGLTKFSLLKLSLVRDGKMSPEIAWVSDRSRREYHSVTLLTHHIVKTMSINLLLKQLNEAPLKEYPISNRHFPNNSFFSSQNTFPWNCPIRLENLSCDRGFVQFHMKDTQFCHSAHRQKFRKYLGVLDKTCCK